MATAIYIGLLAVAESIDDKPCPNLGFYFVLFIGVVVYDIVTLGAL